MAAAKLGEHQQFTKIDKACEQQTKVVSIAILVAEQTFPSFHAAAQKNAKQFEMLWQKQSLRRLH